MNQTELQNQILLVMKSLNSVLLGKEQQVKLAVTCMLANGHLLIEDLPGMGFLMLWPMSLG